LWVRSLQRPSPLAYALGQAAAFAMSVARAANQQQQHRASNPSMSSTRLNRPQVPFFKSSVWPGRESNPSYQLLLRVLNQSIIIKLTRDRCKCDFLSREVHNVQHTINSSKRFAMKPCFLKMEFMETSRVFAAPEDKAYFDTSVVKFTDASHDASLSTDVSCRLWQWLSVARNKCIFTKILKS